MFVASGVGPFSGQAVHFRHHATEKVPYAHNRYQFEAQRHYGILNDRLAKHKYMVGDTYTIVDMDVWGWARMVPFIMGDDAWAKLPNVKRLVDEINARPAAAKANGLKDKFKFKAEMDDEARANMFRHLKTQAAA
jgi:GST-like protein